MKKSKILHFLAICLLVGSFQQNQYANNEITPKNMMILATLGTGATAAALRLSGNGIYQSITLAATAVALNIPSEVIGGPSAEKTHKHTHAWYTYQLATKYPLAQFKKKPLHVSFQNASIPKAIFIDGDASTAINKILEKQSNKISLSTEERNEISAMEFILLHEAAHINNNDHINKLLLTAGVTGGLELVYQKYKKNQPILPPSKSWSQATWKLTKSLPKRVAIFGAMATTTSVIQSAYSRHFETQADAFAIQHADTPALKAGCEFFEKLNEENKIFIEAVQPSIAFTTLPLFSIHPSMESRIEKMQKEIKRREKN